NYIVIENLGESTIIDFVVTENGQTYEFIDDWDIDASQSEKAFRNGIIETNNGYELSWGIGMYGEHEYIVEYTVTDFIKQLEDSQILFWRFVNDQLNTPPENVTIEIETDAALSEETEKIWGFGFIGEVQFYDGKVIAHNDYPIGVDDYVTLLIKFADGKFRTNDDIDRSFEEVQAEAFEGSDYGEEQRSWFTWFDSPVLKNTFLILFLATMIFLRYYNPSIKITKKKPNIFVRKYRDEYYRDFPYEGNFLDIYYLLYIMGVTNFEKLLTVFILKWMKEEKILVETEDIGFINTKEVAAIYFFDKEMDTTSQEG